MSKRKHYPKQGFRGLAIWCTNVKDYRTLVETIDIFAKRKCHSIVFVCASFNQIIAIGKDYELECLELALLYTPFSYNSLDNFIDCDFDDLIHTMEQAVKDGTIH